MTEAGGRSSRRVLLFGATGTIGRATARALVDAGHEVVCIARAKADAASLPASAIVRVANVTDPGSLAGEGIRGERFDAAISCLASRTGVADDAWAIDYRANRAALSAAAAAGAGHFVLLSAICVQNPRLAFQKAKLAFEADLQGFGCDWTIVRPTAFFKSLSGQIGRVRSGKPFLVFGDGRLTACKPISDGDLARYLVLCLGDPGLRNRILPVGGPGPAITPLDQAEALGKLIGRPVSVRRVPVGLISAIGAGLAAAAPFSRRLAAKAELARIGHFYATESMLVLDPVSGRYDADLTPSFGTETLFDYYAAVLRGETKVDLGKHSVF